LTMTDASLTTDWTRTTEFTDADGNVILRGDRIKVTNSAGNTMQSVFLFQGHTATPKGSTWIDAYEVHYAKGKRGAAARSFDPDRVTLHEDEIKARAKAVKAAAAEAKRRKPGVRKVRRPQV
jgi:hypothetical protein